ncbi:MAG: hypothetical protein KatS3mg105_2217 [Gemmatales bacterium]|nr:MAG: hypothetical protein KatS3mg105_2217 [Gemmatales bacterium]
MTRCYLVCGPTSSGNRLVTRLLVAAGCAGKGDHYQPWDIPGQWDRVALPQADQQSVVLCRSLPHGVEGCWPDLHCLLGDILASGYEPFVVVTVRDPTCSERSHVLNHACAGDYCRAYRTIFSAIGDLPWTFAVYESLLLGGLAAVNALLGRCGLSALAELPEPVRNENIKHW